MKKLTIAIAAAILVGFLAVGISQVFQKRQPETVAPGTTSTSTDVGFVPLASSTPVEPAPARKSAPTPPQPIAPKAQVATTSPAPEVSHLDAYDAEMLKDMNLARVTEGLAPLKESAALDRVAEDKLQDMITHSTFDHVGSDGQMSWHWFGQEGYKYKYAGENLAKDFPNADDAYAAYMNSPTHKANILNVHYIDVGLASQGAYEAVEFGSL